MFNLINVFDMENTIVFDSFKMFEESTKSVKAITNGLSVITDEIDRLYKTGSAVGLKPDSVEQSLLSSIYEALNDIRRDYSEYVKECCRDSMSLEIDSE